MLLPADAEFGGEPMRCRGQRRVRIAAQDRGRRLDVGFAGERGCDVRGQAPPLRSRRLLLRRPPARHRGSPPRPSPASGPRTRSGRPRTAARSCRSPQCRCGRECLGPSTATTSGMAFAASASSRTSLPQATLLRTRGRVERVRRFGHVVDIERLTGDRASARCRAVARRGPCRSQRLDLQHATRLGETQFQPPQQVGRDCRR